MIMQADYTKKQVGIEYGTFDSMSLSHNLCAIGWWQNNNFSDFLFFWEDSIPSPGGQICISTFYHQIDW